MLKVEELIHVINFSFGPKGRRRRRIPAGFCYVCSQLDPRGRGPNNPYRHLFSKGFLRPCPHLTPVAPHPTFIASDEDYVDDGYDEGSWELEGGEGGAMFDTGILRDDAEQDPRLFSLPPVFGKHGEQSLKQKRRSKNGRLVPMISENTFLSTNARAEGQNGNNLHLPRLSDQRAALVAAEGTEGQDERKRKQKDPRRLNSERIDRRVEGSPGERTTRSDSALGLGMTQAYTDLSREKTDSPPQPIMVSIRNQNGEVLQRMPLEDLPPGTIPSEAFVHQQGKSSRKKKEKKRRPRSRNGSMSPCFSGSITISRETTLSGLDSPDYFLSRLRSASWCECPDQSASDSRCAECRLVKDHEKWCVSRNSICQNCGKAFKRKYSQLDRKSSFSTIPASGMIINSMPSSGSPTRSRHQNCSPTKASDPYSPKGKLPRETSSNRVRFHEDGGVVYPQWETFPDSGVEEDKEREETDSRQKGKTDKPVGQGQWEQRSYLPSLESNVHQRAYNLALADAKLKAMFQKKKGLQSLQHPNGGGYFSYFPLLKRPKPIPSEIPGSPTPPQQTIGLRADVREGKQLKGKKGLKHILGDVKLDDYYPGGKRYPPQPSKRDTKGEA